MAIINVVNAVYVVNVVNTTCMSMIQALVVSCSRPPLIPPAATTALMALQ